MYTKTLVVVRQNPSCTGNNRLYAKPEMYTKQYQSLLGAVVSCTLSCKLYTKTEAVTRECEGPPRVSALQRSVSEQCADLQPVSMQCADLYSVSKRHCKLCTHTAQAALCERAACCAAACEHATCIFQTKLTSIQVNRHTVHVRGSLAHPPRDFASRRTRDRQEPCLNLPTRLSCVDVSFHFET